jgi:DNA-binding Lrp family transcriptional regulator
MLLSDSELQLLEILRKDAKKTVAALARELSVSRPTVHNMLNKLETVAIKHYTVELKPDFSNTQIRSFVFMTRHPKEWASIKSGLAKIPQVRSVYTVTGQFDAIIELEVSAGNFSDMDRILAQIVALDGVIKTQTCMVLAGGSVEHP